MYGKAPARQTVYSEFVSSRVKFLMGQGREMYDIKELAFACGLKPTHNFKRRIMQLVDQDIIRMTAAHTEKGRLTAVFHLPEVGFEEKLPF